MSTPSNYILCAKKDGNDLAARIEKDLTACGHAPLPGRG